VPWERLYVTLPDAGVSGVCPARTALSVTDAPVTPLPVCGVVVRVRGVVAAPAEIGAAPSEITIAVVVAPTMAKSRLSLIVPFS
jgi:hypothetical protein